MHELCWLVEGTSPGSRLCDKEGMQLAHLGIELQKHQWEVESETRKGRNPDTEGQLGIDPSREPQRKYRPYFILVPSKGQEGWVIYPPTFIPSWLRVFLGMNSPKLPRYIYLPHMCTKHGFKTRESPKASACDRKQLLIYCRNLNTTGNSSQSVVPGPAGKLGRNANS